MTIEAKTALERILKLCEKSRKPTHRTYRIYDVALEGLGMVATQRISVMREKLGGHAADKYIQRQEAELAKVQARKQRQKENYGN